MTQQVLFRGKGQGRGASDSRAEMNVERLVPSQFGARSNQAHVPQDDVEKLRKLVELVFAQP